MSTVLENDAINLFCDLLTFITDCCQTGNLDLETPVGQETLGDLITRSKNVLEVLAENGIMTESNAEKYCNKRKFPYPSVGDRVEFVVEDFGDHSMIPVGSRGTVQEVNDDGPYVGVFIKMDTPIPGCSAIDNPDNLWAIYEGCGPEQHPDGHWMNWDEQFWYRCKIIS